jgi:DNA-binding CsgD family transcriptional regulator
MKVLLDGALLESPFAMIEVWRGLLSDAVVEAFDPFATPTALHACFARVRPDVLVVSPQWLTIAPLLFTLLEFSGNLGTRRVIGSPVINDVVKIQSFYRGYFDVIDLSQPIERAARQVERIHRGESSLHDDVLWARVPRPSLVGGVTSGSRNQTDTDILELLSIGMRDSDIASALFLSLQTIKNRISGMLDRAGASNRTQLAFHFADHKMLTEMTRHAHHEKGVRPEAKAVS